MLTDSSIGSRCFLRNLRCPVTTCGIHGDFSYRRSTTTSQILRRNNGGVAALQGQTTASYLMDWMKRRLPQRHSLNSGKECAETFSKPDHT